jgi:hypothetical protein
MLKVIKQYMKVNLYYVVVLVKKSQLSAAIWENNQGNVD